MSKEEIYQKVHDFLVDDLEVEEQNIAPDARLKEDMGIDSLDFVDIVVIVEKQFGFRLNAADIKQVTTMQQFCDYIDSKINA